MINRTYLKKFESKFHMFVVINLHCDHKLISLKNFVSFKKFIESLRIINLYRHHEFTLLKKFASLKKFIELLYYASLKKFVSKFHLYTSQKYFIYSL